jgi:tetratricopeptide (TPR) repeat protein
VLGQLATSREAYDSAQRFFRLAAARPEPAIQSYALNSLASVEMLHGKLADAERSYRELMAVSEKRGQAGSYVANAALISDMGAVYRRDKSGTLKPVEAALQRYPLAKLSPLDRPYSELAIAYALAGQPAPAKQMLAEYEANVPEAIRRANPWRHYAAGLTALADARAPDAITEFRTWSDALGLPDPATFELGLAYDAAKQTDSALAVYQRAVTVPKHLFTFYSDAYDLARNYKRLGELYEERGNRDRAAEYYGKLIDLWKDADAELQPQVKEVKDRLAKLAGEKR